MHICVKCIGNVCVLHVWYVTWTVTMSGDGDTQLFSSFPGITKSPNLCQKSPTVCQMRPTNTLSLFSSFPDPDVSSAAADFWGCHIPYSIFNIAYTFCIACYICLSCCISDPDVRPLLLAAQQQQKEEGSLQVMNIYIYSRTFVCIYIAIMMVVLPLVRSMSCYVYTEYV